ncbi:MAG: hypothetical protein CVU47_01710 [Chloroflexi bacterium HGW-Chloroflexi-9]|nr:MAG: hypothetical protein CVU47_01710 [Chloroflexi bacterium HGW-Chloroflexi-9]
MTHLPARQALSWFTTALVFTISVLAVHASPAGAAEAVAIPDTASTTSGVPVIIPVLANDADPELGVLTLISVSDPANGSAVIDGDTVVYTSDPGFVGDDVFTYEVQDEELLVSIGTVTVTVSALPNNPPLATNDFASTTSGTPVSINVLSNDFDPDGHAISISPGALARAAISDLSPSLQWECLPAGGAGVIVDRSGNGRDGIATGLEAGSTTGDCDGGTAMTFWSWANASVVTSVPGLPSGSAPRSIMVRFKGNFAGPGDVGLFGLGTNGVGNGQFSISRTGLGNDRLYFAAWGNDTVIELPAGTNLGDGIEHTLVVVYDGATGLTAYVDGVAGPTANLFIPLGTLDGQVMLGQTLYGGAGAGDEMRQFAVFPTALSASVIASLHSAVSAAAAYQSFTQPANGVVTLDGNNLLYTPNLGFTGTDSFTYSISDAFGAIAGATVTVDVQAAVVTNQPPVAVDDVASTVGVTPVLIDVVANDTDPDGDPVSISPGALARAAIDGLGPVLHWECLPAGGAATLTDLSGNGRDGVVTGVTAGAATGDCDGGTSLAFFPGDSVTLTSPGLPSGSSPRSFLLRFKANVGGGDVGLFGAGTNAVGNGQFSIARTGLGNDKLYFAAWGNDAVIDLPAGTNLGDGIEHTLVLVYDGATGLTAYVDGVAGPTANLFIPLDTVDGVVHLGQTVYGAAGFGDELRQFAVYAGALSAPQIEGLHQAIDAAAAFQAFTQPANGVVTLTGNAVTYTANPGFTGVDTFSYSVSDGRGGIAAATVTVTVTAGLLAVDDGANTLTNDPVTIDVLANDAGDGIAIDSVTQPANGVVTTDGLTVTYTSNPNFVGTDTFTYTIINADLNTSTGTVTVLVAPDNIFPVAVDDTAIAPFETSVTIPVLDNDSDADGGTLFISPGALARAAILRQGPLLHWECLPFGGSATQFDTSGNGRTGIVGAGITPGTYTGDCDNGSSMVFNPGPTGVISLTNPDLPTGAQPRAALVRYKANQPLPADIPLFGYGLNGTPFAQFTVSRTILGNDKLIFTSWANDLHFDLQPGFNIADGLEHTIMFVYDGNVTVYAYVDGVQSAPGTLGIPLQTVDDTVMLGHSPWGWQGAGDEMRQFAIFPDAVNEADAYLIHAAIEAAVLNRAFTKPQFGSLSLSPDFLTITYTPDPGYSGTDQFLYSVSDGQGGASVALVTLTVMGPVIAVDDLALVSGATTIDVLTNDTGAGITITAVTDGAHGTVTTDGSMVTYTPSPLYQGSDSFTYTIEDENGQTRTATVMVNVTPDNAPPVAVDDAATTGQNQPVDIAVLMNDSDPDFDSLHVGSGSAARPTIVALGPSLFWECLPSGGSTLFDFSGNGLTGTLSGGAAAGATTGDCDGGTGISFFGGSVSRSGVGSLPTGNDPRTVVFRFKANFAGPGDIGLFGYGTNLTNFAQFSIARTSLGNDKLVFAGWNNDVVLDLPVGTNLGDGLEHTIALVYDGARGLTAWVDGVAGTTATLWTDLDTGTDLITLGQTLYGAGGAGDELRQLTVFPVALGATELGDIHTAISAAVPNVAFTQPSNGTVTLSGNTFTYTPALNFLGTDTFTYTVSDGRGGIATGTVTVTVEATIVAGDDAPETRAGSQVEVNVLDNDTAPVGGSLAIVSVTQPSNGQAIINGLQVVYIPELGFTGTDTFTYTVEDGLGNVATATVSVTVLPNGLPEGDDIEVSTGPDQSISIEVLAGVTDPDGDSVFLASISDPANGIAYISGNNVVYIPDTAFQGVDTFTVTIVDDFGGILVLTVTVTIQGVPAVLDVATITFLAGATVPMGTPLVSVTQSPANNGVPVGGTIAVTFPAGTTFSGAPSPSDWFIQATPGIGAPPSAVVIDGTTVTFTLAEAIPSGSGFTITGGNTGPAVTFGSVSGDLEVEAGIDAGTGTLALVGVVLTPQWTSIVASDVPTGQNETAIDITFSVPAITGAPDVITIVTTGGTLTGGISYGVDSLIASWVTTGPAASIEANLGSGVLYTSQGGTVALTANSTPGIVTVSIYRGSVLLGSTTVEFRPNNAPEGVDIDATTAAGTAVFIDVLGGVTDPDGDVVTIDAVTQGANGSVTISGGEVVYTPAPGFSGTDSFTATVVDIHGGALTLNVTVDVTNQAPVGDDIEASTVAGTPVTIDVLDGVTDPEGDDVTIDAVTQGANGTVTISGGNVIYTPAPGFSGTDTFTVTVVDEHGSELVLTVTVQVTNAAPVGDDIETVTQAETPITIDVLAGVSDPDGDDLVVDAVTQGASGSVTTDGTEVTYTPVTGFSGTDTFDVTVTDGNGGTLTITVSVLVNGNPVGTDVNASTQAGTPVTIDILAGITDPDGDAVTIDSVTQGANGSVTISGGEVVYTPAPGFSGTDTFTVTVEDENGGTLTITVTVTVNGAPVGADASASTQAETPVTIDILGGVTDPDGDDLAITSVTQGANGSVTISGGNVIYTPAPGFSGTDSFTVTVEDENGGSLTITVTVTVNGAPEGNDIGTTTGADAPVTVDILAGVSDPDGDPLAIDSTTTPANGTVAVSGGSVTYTPNAGFDGEDAFDVTVTDGNGGTATITVTITVAGAPRIFVAADACIAIKVMAFSAGYTSQIWLMGPDGPRYLGVTNQNVNQQVTVGFYAAGTTLDFGIKVQQTGYTFVTGTASANPDNLVHAQINAGSGSVLYVVGFEDVYGGGDQDYNDVVFQVIGIPCVVEASNDTATTPGGTPVTVNVLANDTATVGELTVTAVSTPTSGTATTDGTTITYTPAPGFSGTATFTYTVTDASGATDTATVTVTVQSALEAVDDAAVTPKNTAVTIDVRANDSGTGLTVISVTQPGSGNSKGTVSITGGNVKFTPKKNQTGTVTFTYTVRDSSGATDTATVTVTIGAPTSGGTGTGRMTGGGNIVVSGDRYTFGLSLRCNASGNNFQFNDHDSGVKFHLQTITSVTCSDNPSINPKPRPASIDTMVLTGTGRLGNGATGTVELTITDQGEPGRNDTISVVIKDASGQVISQVSGKLTGGNIQAHH